MIYPGLVSVTFRHLSAKEVITLAVKAQLTAIEWGGDVHVPHGDLDTAKLVSQLTLQAGLKSNAYGSYYRVGSFDNNDVVFQEVINTALVLGAMTIRVWAGEMSSKSASASYWDDVVVDSNRIAEMAALAGISVSFEYHRNTLTDTNSSAAKLLGLITHANIRTFWQPHNNTSLNYSLEGLSRMLPHLSDLHVFFWKDPENRYPLAAGEMVWLPLLALANKTNKDHFVSLEFVEGNSPENFLKDARTLKSWIKLIENKHKNLVAKNREKVVLIGMASSGKKQIGELLAKKLNVALIDQDREVEKIHYLKTQDTLTSRDIYVQCGPDYFRTLESEVLTAIYTQFESKAFVFVAGISTPMVLEDMKQLKEMSLLIHIDSRQYSLAQRTLSDDLPDVFSSDLSEELLPIYRRLADIIMQSTQETPEEIASHLAKQVRSSGYVD